MAPGQGAGGQNPPVQYGLPARRPRRPIRTSRPGADEDIYLAATEAAPGLSREVCERVPDRRLPYRCQADGGPPGWVGT